MTPGTVDAELISGTVLAENQTPVAGALVLAMTSANTMWEAERYRIRRHALTDENGNYEIAPDPKLVSVTGTYGYRQIAVGLFVTHPDYGWVMHLLPEEESEYLDLETVLTLDTGVTDENVATGCDIVGESYCTCLQNYLKNRIWRCE
ncbi:MAG: hypothetical protein ACR2RD_01285 [Woeseiaceae bacterium]